MRVTTTEDIIETISRVKRDLPDAKRATRRYIEGRLKTLYNNIIDDQRYPMESK